mmetsp:Transcript_29932/g.87551  ORF Transcript_29932/g.87551 Transcript_29932/m.87551 type:complete len:197 (-) Transcript_29932:201-791(-)
MYGTEPYALLLGWGDLAALRAGARKVLGAHRRILDRVRDGAATADGYFYESVVVVYCLVPALLAAGELDMVRELMTNSLGGAALTDEVVRESVLRFYELGGAYAWTSDDGITISPATRGCFWCAGCGHCSTRTPKRAVPRYANGCRLPSSCYASLNMSVHGACSRWAPLIRPCCARDCTASGWAAGRRRPKWRTAC